MLYTANRFYLDSVNRPEGTIWFTLVLKDSSTFFVEQFSDSVLSFLTGRTKTIRPDDFGNYSINGKSLAEVVENKLREINTAASCADASIKDRL